MPGKSVTIKTISGLWQPTRGEILWEGAPVHIHGPNDAEALGITTIYQDLALCDNLDIVQNMFLGHEKLRHGLLDEAAMESRARKTLADLHVTTVRSIRQPVASLSGGQRQSVAVAKAVMSAAKLVIMDEPTAALGVAQTRTVLDLIKRLSSQGTAVMVVSHNLNDVFAVADQISILYLGRMVAGARRRSSTAQVVVDYMTTGPVVPGGGGGVTRTMTDTIDEPAASDQAAGAQPPDTGPSPAPSTHDTGGPGPRRPRRLPGRLPPGLVEADPWRRERRAADHRRPHRHLHLLRGAVERLLDGDEHRQPLRPGDLHHPARPGGAVRACS